MFASCVALGTVGSVCLEEASCGVIGVAAIFFFVFSFAYGWGPIAWVYCSEMFPTKYRAKANGLTTMANWIGNFLVSVHPDMASVGRDGSGIIPSLCVSSHPSSQPHGPHEALLSRRHKRCA
jgi:MFS family permease